MKILYIRNVPDEVGERLARLANAAGLSLSAFVVRELSQIARRADNPKLLSGLADFGLEPGDLVADLEEARLKR